MALSAADLQKRHELEGAPDPFPALGNDSPVRPKRNGGPPTPATLDTESELAFPSLAPNPRSQQAPRASAWSAGPRITPAVQTKPLFKESFALGSIDLSSAGKDGKPGTLGAVLKQVMVKFPKVRVEASSNTSTRQTTFHMKSESAKELDKAKRYLVAAVSPVVTLVLNAPASTIPVIIGPKGASLKQIRDQTNVKIDIPRRENISTPQANGHGNATPVDNVDDEEEEILVPITVIGPQPLVAEAESLLKAIIASRTSKTTQRVRDIPQHILPFILARRPEFVAEAGGVDIDLSLNSAQREISAAGDREVVTKVVDKIKATIAYLEVELKQFSMVLPKRQHRLLTGKASDEIMAKSKCGVIVPQPEDPSEQIIVWGDANDLSAGMAAIMQKANSLYIHEFPLPGPIEISRQIVTYLGKTSYVKTLNSVHQDVQVYLPAQGLLKTAKTLNIDLVGEKAKVDSAVEQLASFIGDLIGATKSVEVDWLLHKVIMGKNAKKIKQFHDAHNVRLFFPNDAAEESSILLVYDPTSPSASKNPIEKSQHLADVEKDILKLARDAADVKSELVPVETKWHADVAGKDGTTLNAIIGEDKALSIKIGKDAGGETEDFILVRGTSSDVDHAVKEILAIVERAKNDLVDNSYSVDFEIDRAFVGRVVGSHGAAVNRLRESLGVKVDFSDEAEEKDAGKKKKAPVQKAKVTIVGRKENVDEAKRRILAQVERLADETSEVLKIPAQYHASLIGQSGKYVIRLEEKYGVKITFPREANEGGEGRTREPLKPDEVLVKGGRKGVASAKAEILEAAEFEKESNNVVKFTVSSKSVARILGRGGASINTIKDDTGAQIDVDKTEDPLKTSITCRGTKSAIAAAKASIIAIAEQMDNEVTMTINIERKYHRNIIGAGGQGLRDIVTRCGGPTNVKQQASLIRFPNQSEPSDEIRLRGEPALVKKLHSELEKIASQLRDRVVLYVEVPNSQHRNLIGRNGQHLNDLQSRTGAQVQFPGSRSYGQLGEGENAADFADANPQDLVKVSGPKAACEKAIKELKAEIKPPAADLLTDTVQIPIKYHHFISQQGNFFRKLRGVGVNVEQSNVPPKQPPPSRPISEGATSARIDDAVEEAQGVEWQVIPYFQDTQEGESTWTLKAKDASSLENAKKLIADAIEQAEKSSMAGFLTLPDRSAFPRIVGTKGANVSRLRAETGTDITVSREDNTITIVGSQSAIEAAKDAILRIVNNRGGRRGE